MSRQKYILPQADAPHVAKGQPPVVAPVQGANALWRVGQWFPKLSPETVNLLGMFHSELLKFNAKLNLISRNTEREADETHFADSILACQAILSSTKNPRIFDLGSGNGFPGLILAILEPAREVNLVEADARKCEFLKHMAHFLKLPKVILHNVRLETLNAVKMEVAVNRGFASISATCLQLNRLMPKGATVFHLKGNNWANEIAEMPVQLMSHWEPKLVGEYSLPVSQARHAVVCTVKLQ